jgi:hypothetical protein
MVLIAFVKIYYYSFDNNSCGISKIRSLSSSKITERSALKPLELFS